MENPLAGVSDDFVKSREAKLGPRRLGGAGWFGWVGEWQWGSIRAPW
jgi:hypothetical protein